MNRLQRVPDWQSRLARFEEHLRTVVFDWGGADCALLSADWVLLATGVDFAAAFRGRYSTARGAARALRTFGSGDLISTVDAFLPRHAHVSALQRGDIVAMHFEEDPALGIVSLDAKSAWVPLPTQNAARFDLTVASIAWKVGT